MVGTHICKIMYLIWLKPRIYMRMWLNTDKCELLWLQRHYLNRKFECCCLNIWNVWMFVVVIQLLSHVRLCTLMDCSTPRSSVLHCLLEFAQIHVHWVSDANRLIICRPLLLLPQSLPASEPFPTSQLFAWGGQSTGVSALASFLPKNTQNTQDWTPQFKSNNSSLLSFLHSSTLTSIHDHWKNHSLD